ncbi:MAG: adenylate/guanylate cyclase domain-containing protein [Desulfatiglandaceae bacterium]
MKKYYEERFKALRRLDERIAPLMEINDILEKMRDELRETISSALEVRILLLDPDAKRYTRPLQCILYDRPVNCLSCKRSRPVIQKALEERKAVLVPESDPIERDDGSLVKIGPEAAVPAFVGEDILVVLSVVGKPGTTFTHKDFLLIEDFSETARSVILRAKKHWEMTEEKIRISKMLTHLSPFVPLSVLDIVEKNPERLLQEKEKKDVTVLFLDLEDYTRLSTALPEMEVNQIVETMFSSFVDPIHRSNGDINETAGDGLMIIFKEGDVNTNAKNAVKAALDIHDMSREINKGLASQRDPINVNMGINSGTALVGMTRFKGSLDTRMTYTASGPVTNAAARLADYAQGGDILIGEETKQLIDGLWPVYDVGLATLKGIDKPMRIFSLFKNIT